VVALRHVFFLDLADDEAAIDTYQRSHAAGAVPQPVIDHIKSTGFGEMEIYRTGNRLVMIAEIDPDFDPANRAEADANNPAIVDWERRMSEFQRPLLWAAPNEKWTPGHRIFALESADEKANQIGKPSCK
jgi:L-rhamnose mutarotase